MAIQFLNTVDLNQNQLNNAAIQNIATDPLTGVLGQIVFNTTLNHLRICITASSTGPTVNAVYEEVGGGVDTFTNSSGTYVAYGTNNTNAVGDVNTGSIDLTAVDGTSVAADRFLTKNNKWATIPFGDITEVQGGTYISVTDQTGPVPIVNHDTTNRSDTASSASPVLSGNFTAVDGVTTNTTGHITALNVKTVTLPTSDNYVNWVSSDNTTSNNVTSGETIKWVGAGTTGVVLSGDTFTITSNDEFDGTVTSLTASHAGSAFTTSIGNVSTVNPSVDTVANGTADQYVSGQGDLITFPNIPQGDITAVLAGTYVNIDNSAGPEPTVNHNATSRTDTTSSTSPGSTGFFTSVDSVTTNATGHLIALNIKTVTLPSSDNYSSWLLSGDTGASQTISSGDDTVFSGGTKISTASSATDTLTINHDDTSRTDTASSGSGNTFTAVNTIATDATGHVTAVNLETVTVPDNNTTYSLLTAPTGTSIRLSGNPSDNDVTISGTTGRTLVSRINASELRVDLTSDVTIANDLTVTGEINVSGVGSSSFAGVVDMTNHKILNVKTGTAGTDAVNLGQVESLVAGIGVFKGAYNASTNSPALEGASNISLDQGDYFVVNVVGTFFTQTLQVGDNVFATTDIAANSTPSLSDYTVIQAGANIAASGATDGATQKGIAGFDSANFNVSAGGWVQLDKLSNPYGASVVLTSGVTSGTETTFTVDVTTLFGATAAAENCRAEVIRVSDLETAYPVVDRNGTGSMAFKFSPAKEDDLYKALISII